MLELRSLRITLSLFRNNAHYLHAFKLRIKPTDLHLLGANSFVFHFLKFSLALRLNPAEQHLLNHPQRASYRSNPLANTAATHTASCLKSGVKRTLSCFLPLRRLHLN